MGPELIENVMLLFLTSETDFCSRVKVVVLNSSLKKGQMTYTAKHFTNLRSINHVLYTIILLICIALLLNYYTYNLRGNNY